jgi:two-component system cell cycle response regulator
MRSKYLAGILFGLVAAAVFLAGFNSLYRTPDGAWPAEGLVSLKTPGGIATPGPAVWYMNASDSAKFIPGLYEVRFSFHLPENESLPGPECHLSLVFPYTGGSAMEVRVNGVWAGSRGDMAEGRSSIWNSAKIFPLPPGLVGRDTIVDVAIKGVYEAGVIRLPYIVDAQRFRGHLAALAFASDTAVWMLCGILVFMGLTILTLGFTALPAFDARILLGATCVATGIFLCDFAHFEILPLPLLEFKRLVVVLRHLVAIAFTAGILRLLGRRIDWFARIFMAVQGICAILLLFPATMIDMKRLYDRCYLTILPLQFYLFWLMVRERKTAFSHQFLLFGVSVGVLAVIKDTLAAFLQPDAVLVSHYGFMFLSLSVAAYVVVDMADRNRQLLLEKLRAERFREASIRDPLTGAFNRNVLPLVRESLSGPYSLVAIDMDGLKTINDRYGHLAGDNVLVDFVSAARKLRREEDRIVRMGGDEFLIALPGRIGADARAFAEELQAQVARSRVCIGAEGAESSLPGPKKPIRYSVSMGVASSFAEGHPSATQFEALVLEADAELYRVKSARPKESKRKA